MKKINYLFLLIITTATFTSCSSDSGSSESNGITTGNYLPLAVGNKWNYTDGSTSTQDHIIGTTDFGGTTYYESDDTMNTLGNQNWMAKKGASYFQKVGISNQPQGSTSIVVQSYEMKMLKDDLAVGENWHGSASPKVTYSGPSGSGSFNASINYTGVITAKGVSETLEGVTYDNIIKVEMTAVVNSNGQVNTIESEYWLAKDIGIIMDSVTSSIDNITKTRYLTSYELH